MARFRCPKGHLDGWTGSGEGGRRGQRRGESASDAMNRAAGSPQCADFCMPDRKADAEWGPRSAALYWHANRNSWLKALQENRAEANLSAIREICSSGLNVTASALKRGDVSSAARARRIGRAGTILRARMFQSRAAVWDEAYYRRPPWIIDHPPPTYVELLDSGALRGRILEVGCGTGVQLLLLYYAKINKYKPLPALCYDLHGSVGVAVRKRDSIVRPHPSCVGVGGYVKEGGLGRT